MLQFMNFDSKLHYQLHIEGIYFLNNTIILIESTPENLRLFCKAVEAMKFIHNTIAFHRNFTHYF